mmetsp:Transcript_123888/g.264064  ORF Transcript_123888/g.264064 Transcript_123888/m.264064 type:complete len:233 (-) Transcript_123888:781-1479(-)
MLGNAARNQPRPLPRPHLCSHSHFADPSFSVFLPCRLRPVSPAAPSPTWPFPSPGVLYLRRYENPAPHASSLPRPRSTSCRYVSDSSWSHCLSSLFRHRRPDGLPCSPHRCRLARPPQPQPQPQPFSLCLSSPSLLSHRRQSRHSFRSPHPFLLPTPCSIPRLLHLHQLARHQPAPHNHLPKAPPASNRPLRHPRAPNQPSRARRPSACHGAPSVSPMRHGIGPVSPQMGMD